MARFLPQVERCGGDRGRSLAPPCRVCAGGALFFLCGVEVGGLGFFLGRALRCSPLEAPLDGVSSWQTTEPIRHERNPDGSFHHPRRRLGGIS